MQVQDKSKSITFNKKERTVCKFLQLKVTRISDWTPVRPKVPSTSRTSICVDMCTAEAGALV